MKLLRQSYVFLLVLAAISLSIASRTARQHRTRPQTQVVPDLRDAGPENMQSPPKDWDMIDEQGDESFPASDPPGNY